MGDLETRLKHARDELESLRNAVSAEEAEVARLQEELSTLAVESSPDNQTSGTDSSQPTVASDVDQRSPIFPLELFLAISEYLPVRLGPGLWPTSRPRTAIYTFC